MTPLSLGTGVVLLCVAWSPWMRELTARFFTAHMAVHMTVVALAAPLIVFGLARRSRGDGRIDPIVASIVELIVVWMWHVPALHHAARESLAMFAVEQGSFLGSGLLLWGAVLRAPGSGIVALLLTFAHMTLLGAILSLSPRVLYHHGTMSQTLLDQQIGGTVMLIVSAVVYTAGGVWLGYTSLHREVVVRS